MNLILQVEREPEFLPAVRRVQVLSREGNGVRYRVQGRLLWWAIYRKWRENTTALRWESEAGAFGLEHSGRLDFTPAGAETEVTLHTRFRFTLPLIGAALTRWSRWWVQRQMEEWLRRLASCRDS